MVGAHDKKGALQAQKTMVRDGRFSVVHLFTVALMAFLVGYLFPRGLR